MQMTGQVEVHLQWTELVMGYGLWGGKGVPEQPLLLGPVLSYENKLVRTHETSAALSPCNMLPVHIQRFGLRSNEGFLFSFDGQYPDLFFPKIR